jgi:predicted alpha-1,2-mannosidase
MKIDRREFFKRSTLAAAATQLRLARADVDMADPVDAINPIIGASTSTALGEGKTFPGVTAPFGLVQLSPDTITGGDNAPGYSYDHTTIEGFSFTHMSGVGWFGDFGNLLVMPTVGELKTVCGRPSHPGEGWRSGFEHAREVAQCGYYAVTLDKYGIRAELTAAEYAGMLRFRFPKAENARIQIDLARRIGGTSTRQYVRVIDGQTIEGWAHCPASGGGWGNGKGHVTYRIFFRMKFSRPWKECGVWQVDVPASMLASGDDLIADRFQSDAYYEAARNAHVTRGITDIESDHMGFFAEYATDTQEQILVKAGISFVDLEGARANLDRDIPDWNFEAVRNRTRGQWREELERVEIDGATPAQKMIFATALYHASIDPRKISDADGRYHAADGVIRSEEGYSHRTIFSGWDVYRAELPLMTILKPDLVNDQICSLLDLARRSGKGYLERWEIMNAYSGCMDGDPAVAVIADAFSKGIRGYDTEQAYAACRQSVAGVGTATARPDNEFYMAHGFVPEQISWTLDNAFFDWCTGRLASQLNKASDAALFRTRALNYKKIYDPKVQSMRARHRNGEWMEWKGSTGFGQGCTESNPLQQTWSVPHDVYGLMELMGKERFGASLEQLFEETPPSFGWNPYYNHSNEPVHHIAYLFVYAGKPWLTQKWVRRILDLAYKPAVNGICGNDDVGQMSAWYVISALGFYPTCPGSNYYIIGSPLFERARIRLDRKWHKGSSFTVIARNNSENSPYIQSATLNGVPLLRSWITHEEIVSGGTLEFQMGPAANESWGSGAAHLPPDPMRLLS